MNSTVTNHPRSLWRRSHWVDLAALAILFLFVAWIGVRWLYAQAPVSGLLVLLALIAAGYLAVRGFLWARKSLLWSLRNRLIVAYVFIAVVPVALLLAMAGLSAYLLYWQLGSYVLYTEVQEREEQIAGVAATMATSYALEMASGRRAAAVALPEGAPTYLQAAMAELPGLKVETGAGEELLLGPGVSLRDRFAGLVYSKGALALRAVVARSVPSGRLVVSASVSVTPELMETLAPELGPIQFDILRPTADVPAAPLMVNGKGFARVQRIATRSRSVPRGRNLFDKLIIGITTLDIVDTDRASPEGEASRVLATFSTRPSLLNRRLFSPLGELGSVAATALLIVGAVFLVIEVASLATGVVLTRTITAAVADLYRATQHVQSGDLRFRVHVAQRDQLGALGESFNSMMHSVSTLIEEQRQRQRLENELSIAREVQQQLFPHKLPHVAGVELEAVCRAARVVSGDYYDFIRLSPTRLAIALADISGKGISAALLMASVQAALRSDVLRPRGKRPGANHSELNTAEIVSHLNRHLFRNTSDERYATMFLAVYDAETRRLTYTNAGHLPPAYICGGRVQTLETGGMVVGLFNDVPFEQATMEVSPGGLLVAYSDGLIEPENVYGEEFGSERLVGIAMDHQGASPHDTAEAIVRAAEEWSGSPEQADDMTVIVARFSENSEEPPA